MCVGHVGKSGIGCESWALGVLRCGLVHGHVCRAVDCLALVVRAVFCSGLPQPSSGWFCSFWCQFWWSRAVAPRPQG